MAKNKEYELAIKIAGEVEKSFLNSTKMTKKELRDLAKAASTSSAGMGQSIRAGLGNVSGVFGGIEKAAVTAVKATVAAVAAAGVAVVGGSISVGSAFEAQMSTVQSISGASAGELGSLTKKAQEMGIKTKFSATEAGKAMEYMAMAGWKTDQMLGGIEGIMNLAAASGEDLATTSDIVTDALTAFGMQASDTVYFADLLAKASSSSNTNVAMMGETFKYVAPVAGALGYTAADTALAVGLMANSGIKASQAGTSLRRIFTATTSGVELMGKAFAETGKQQGKMYVETVNADGSMREFKDILDDLRLGFSGLTESEKAANAESIAGKTGMSGLLAIVNASEKDYNKLYKSITKCGGAAKEMSEIRLDNLQGDVELAKSAMEGAGIEIYNTMKGPLREGVQAATELISEFTKQFPSKIPTVIRHVKSLGSAFTSFAKPLMSMGKWLIQNPGVIVSTIVGIGSALATYKIASGIMAMVSAFTALTPVGAIILGVGAAIATVTGAITYFSLKEKEMANLNLAEHFGDITLSMEELQKAARHIIGDDYFTQIGAILSSIDISDGLVKSMEDALGVVNKTKWKLSIGLELTEGDLQGYEAAVKQYVGDAQNYVTNEGMTVKIATQFLIGESTETKDGGIYAELSQEIEDLSKELEAELKKSLKGGLTLPEAEIISGIMQQITNITNAVTQAQDKAKLQVMEAEFSGKALTPETYQNLQQSITEYLSQAKEGAKAAYQSAMGELNLELEFEKIGQVEYDQKSNEYLAGYFEKQAQAVLNGNKFMKETIMSTYGSEIEPALAQVQENIQKKAKNLFESGEVTDPGALLNGMDSIITEALAEIELPEDAKNAIGILLEGMMPNVEQLSELKEQASKAGVEFSTATMTEINKAMTDNENLSAISGSASAMWKLLGNEIGSNEEYALIAESVQNVTRAIPEEAIRTIREKNPEVISEAKGFLASLKTAFGEGVNVTVPIRITYDEVVQYNNASKGQKNNGNASAPGGSANVPKSNAIEQIRNGTYLIGHAEGGIFDKPHMAWFAEAGTEAVIPINGSKNAMDLWTMTGQMLGVTEPDAGQNVRKVKSFSNSYDGGANRTPQKNAESGQETKITYSPSLNFYGGKPDKKDMDDAITTSQEKFEKMMKQYIKDNGRVKFS